MARRRCYYRGRQVPRSHLYDGGEEPILIGRVHQRRRRVGAGGGLFGVLVLAAVGLLYGFIVFNLLA